MNKYLRRLAVVLSILLASPPSQVWADVPTLVPVTGDPVTASTAPYLYMPGLSGQSACSIDVSGSFSGTINVELLHPGVSIYTAPLLLASPDGVSTQVGVTAPGSWIFNCSNASVVRIDATGVTGTPSVTTNAAGGIGRIIGAGVNGGRTIVNGYAPITVTNAGNTATVGLTTPLTLPQGGTNATALPAGCLVSTGSAVASTPCPTSAPNVAITSGPGIAVATPSPGVFVISNAGLLGLTAGANIQPLTGQTPTVATTNAPTFSGQVSALSFNAGNLTSGDCLESIVGVIQSAGTSCPSGSLGSITSGSNIVVANTNPNAPTVAVTNSPYFTGTLGVVSYLSNFAIPGSDCVGTNVSQTLVGNANCISGLIAGNNMQPMSGATPTVAITAAPTFSQVTDTALTSGRCVQASTSGILTTISSACGTGSGTVTAVTAVGNLASSNGTTPQISMTAAPTFSGVVLSNAAFWASNGGGGYTQGLGAGAAGMSVGCSSACNQQQALSWSVNLSGVTAFIGGDSTKTVQGVPDTYFQVGENNNGTPTVNTAIDPSDGNIGTTGSVASGTLTSGDCLQATTNGVIATLANPCVGAITAGNDIIIGGTVAAPTVGVTNSPTFTGAVAVGSLAVTGSTNNRCLRNNSSDLVNVAAMDCPFSTTSATFVIPAVGSTASVSYLNVTSLMKSFATVQITDGTNSMIGLLTGTANASPITITNEGMVAGAVGNTMASGAFIYVGGSPSVTSYTAPTVQSFTSGSGTYTTPAGVKWIKVNIVGAGGGGGGTGSGAGGGGTGGNTTFGTSLLTAGGGVGGPTSSSSNFGGAGGSPTVSAGPLVELSLSGATGNPVQAGAGSGGSSCYGGAGIGPAAAVAANGMSGVTNSGSGGGGAQTSGVSSATGGGAGACIQVVINAPSATYAYAVGAAGAAGAAGTSGNSGGLGGSGNIFVEEHYNY